MRRRCSALAERLASGQRVRTDNLHVTLVFLGNIDAVQEIRLRSALPAIAVPAISLRFDKVSYWANPRILCLTADETGPELLALVENLSVLARNLDIPCDDRPYRPHVTLVKKAKAGIELAFDPIIWPSRSFCLVESCRTEQGVDYRIVEEWPRR